MQLKAYNPAWSYHDAVRKLAARWQRQQLLTPEQQAAIEVAHPVDYYQPAWPLRVGLFLFTCLGVSMSSGLIFSWFGFFSNTDFPVVLLGSVFFAGCLLALEFAIREKKLYHSGVDNALLYYGLGAGAGLIFYLFERSSPVSYYNTNFFTAMWPIGALLLTLALLLAAVVRYADAFVTAVAFVVYLALVAFVAVVVNAVIGQALLPFLIMLAATVVYLLQRRLAQRDDADYYRNCLNTAKGLALIVFYLGGNYLIVREGNAELSSLIESRQIPFAPLFYFFTAAIPIAYIIWGLRRHDRLMLIIGLLALAFSLFTLRHYRSLLPPEIAATIGGAVLIALSGWLLRYLRPARHGLTSADDDEPRHLNLENFITAQTATVPTAPAHGFEFGGGQSGGGGATGRF